MSQQFDALSDELINWIAEQPMFFVGTAAREGRVNVSPKGQDSLRVLGPNALLWLNLTGSGNESAAHVLDTNRMTVMWCSFQGLPRILRVYGSAEIVHPRDSAWDTCADVLPPPVGARQYFRLNIELVQTSCGYAVPLMAFEDQRTVLTQWAEKRGRDGIVAYWDEKNRHSIDGMPTGIADREELA